MEVINNITTGEGDYAKLAYTLVDNDGYGYIGIQGQAIPEHEVRKALAHSFNVQLSVDNHYGELASVNYRTMTKVLWAYPDNPENMFPYDATGETSKALFLEAGYVYDEAKNVMTYPEGHEKEGTQVTFKYTVPQDIADHPAGSIFIDSQAVLEKIGVKVDIEVDENLLNKLSTAYESGIQVWAAAWGSGGVDPDMFQIWYSDPSVNQGTSAARSGLYWLFENGTEEEKAMLKELNELIMAGRSTLDTEERKAIYKRALELSTGLAVEIPTYQRKNLFVYNKDVIKADTLFSGEDVTPFQSPISYIWNVELN
jgi:peptide/nickel transport system substrate-binding protein